MNNKNKKRNRRTRHEKKHKLQTQDIKTQAAETQDVPKHDIKPTVVPVLANETHAWKSGTSTPNPNAHNDTFLLHAAV